MTLELHIWGPAFGLPSIDPQCLASVAYLNLIFAPDQWVLIAGYDPSQSPTGDFPLLCDGGMRIAGFRAIVRHLHRYHRYGHWMDNNLTVAQRADSVAMSSHITSRAQPLLDYMLYSNSANYNGCTRSAFTPILPRLPTYLVPSARRAAAKARTAPLGLVASQVDSDEPSQNPNSLTEQNTSHATNSPSLLFRAPHTLSSLLHQQNATTNIRLAAHISALLDPLQNALESHPVQENTYLLSTSGPSSVDCLALGYLALLIYPPVPEPLFADTLQRADKYTKVMAYVSRLKRDLLGDRETNVLDAFLAGLNTQHGRTKAPTALLPWRPPTPPTWTTTASTLLGASLDFLLPPRYYFLLTGRVRVPPLEAEGKGALTRTEREERSPIVRRIEDLLFPAGILLLAPVVAVVGVFSLSGSDWFGLNGRRHDNRMGDHHFVVERPRGPASLKGMGEAGALLGALGGFGGTHET